MPAITGWSSSTRTVPIPKRRVASFSCISLTARLVPRAVKAPCSTAALPARLFAGVFCASRGQKNGVPQSSRPGRVRALFHVALFAAFSCAARHPSPAGALPQSRFRPQLRQFDRIGFLSLASRVSAPSLAFPLASVMPRRLASRSITAVHREKYSLAKYGCRRSETRPLPVMDAPFPAGGGHARVENRLISRASSLIPRNLAPSISFPRGQR